MSFNNFDDQAFEDPSARSYRDAPLQRSRDDKFLGGVCGGIARKYGIDATYVRGFLALVTLFFQPALALYLLAWVIIPADRSAQR